VTLSKVAFGVNLRDKIENTMVELSVPNSGPKPAAMHVEGSGISIDTGKIHNGDAALALFDNLDDIHGGFEPGEEKKLVRKIDLMILPFLSVCYAFYYVRPPLTGTWGVTS
jgi:hypothetical protein